VRHSDSCHVTPLTESTVVVRSGGGRLTTGANTAFTGWREMLVNLILHRRRLANPHSTVIRNSPPKQEAEEGWDNEEG
jgi:hypothetical protein